MRVPTELTLEHPFELEGAIYDKIAVADFSAIAKFETHNAPRVIRSLANVFGIPRRAVRHLHPYDTARAGEMIIAVLNDVTTSMKAK